MPGLQDLPVRLAELLDLSPAEALQLTARVVPVITLESIVGVPSTRVSGLVGAPAFGSGFQGPVVAEFSHVQLFNPAGSGMEVHLDTAIPTAGAAGGSSIRRHDTALTTLEASESWRDFRRRGAPGAQVRIGAFAAVQGSLIGAVSTSAQNVINVPFESVILAEGQGILFNFDTANRFMQVFWLWREVQV